MIKKISLLLFFLVNLSFGQKKIEIPINSIAQSFTNRLLNNLEYLNLENLKESTDSLNIRMWRRQDVFTINYKKNSVSAEYKLVDATQRPIRAKAVKIEVNAQKLLDSLVSNGLLSLKDDPYRGIDGYFVFFEIATRKTYKVVSFWSPHIDRSEDSKSVFKILKKIEKNVEHFKLKKND